jgi:anti-sigma factor RsiW
MSCPDDDTYARFIQGLLPEAARREVEAHLDGCPLCGELLAELGRAYAEVAETHHSAAPPAPRATPRSTEHGAPENRAPENRAPENHAPENRAPHARAKEPLPDPSAEFASAGEIPQAEFREHALGSQEILRLHGFALVVHLLLTMKVLWAGSHLLLGSPETAPSTDAWATRFSEPWNALLPWYALLLGPVGAVAAAVSVWGALRSRSWGPRAARAHALLTLPHVALAPLAVYVLNRYRA